MTRAPPAPTEGPNAFARASAGVGTTQRLLGIFFSSRTPTSQRMIFDSARKY